jgi:hypothetical protein
MKRHAAVLNNTWPCNEDERRAPTDANGTNSNNSSQSISKNVNEAMTTY